MNLLLAAVCTLAPLGQDLDAIRERIKDPSQVFPVFQELVAAGEYGTAQKLLSPSAMKLMSAETLYLVFASFEPPRRMIASMQVHSVDGSRVRICSREFGVSRDIRLVKFLTIYTLDFTSDDIEFLKGRTLGWYRLQVKKADGWHYAYPPDWTYAPTARSCACGK
jgi:hypothetical protein